jgi:hypothetical protein
MPWRQGLFGVLVLSLAASQASAQSIELTSFFRRPSTCDSCANPASGPITVSPTPTSPLNPDQAPILDQQAFAQAPAAGGEAGTSFNPAMFGDLGTAGTGFINVTTTIRQTVFSSTSTFPTTVTSTSVSRVRVPIVSSGSFKISDNESPRPTDRVFFTYNYYGHVTTPDTSFDLNRELIGFEKTFLDGNASFGMRLPWLQATNFSSDTSGIAADEIGDLTLISKYAFINDRDTGNVLSGGLALTVPSAGHTYTLADGVALRSVLFQPYAAWLINFGDLYAQGFHSLVVPTDSRDITELNTDVGVGYWVYKNEESFLRGVVPTIEGHLYTPLNHTNTSDILYAEDILTFTAGVNVVVPGNSSIGAAIATPLTGPKPNRVEALVGFNFRF